MAAPAPVNPEQMRAIAEMLKAAPAGAVAAIGDLSGSVDASKSGCLNADSRTAVASILKGSGLLKSDAEVDAQLLLHVPFSEAVKLNEISIKADAPDAKEGCSGPLVVKLFANRESLDFSEVEGLAPTQELRLTAAQLSGAKIPLKFVKFQSVHNLAIFVESNQGDTPVTFINRITFYGTTIAGMDVRNIRKADEEQ